jgi:hypothetical protein
VNNNQVINKKPKTKTVTEKNLEKDSREAMQIKSDSFLRQV